MSLKKDQKYAIVIVVAILVGLITLFLLRLYSNSKHTFIISLIPSVFFLIMGLLYVSKDKNNKERFSLGNGLDQNQVINIIQNCGSGPSPGPNPGPSPPSPLSKTDVMNWINSVNSKLTSTCKNCVVNKAISVWNSDILSKIKLESLEKQETILNALLAFNCDKECAVTNSNLNSAQVNQWVYEADSSLSENCHNCVVNNILKSWTQSEYENVLKMSNDKQKDIIQAMIAFNCSLCETPSSLNAQEVQQWMSGLIVGENPDCYACTVSNILKMWDNIQFAQVKAMDKTSQIQTVKALMALNCGKQCTSISSGLSASDVSKWVKGLIRNQDILSCVDSCIVPAIVRLWNPNIFSQIKNKPIIEQQKVLQGIISMNCGNSCFGGSLSKGEIEYIVSLVIPDANQACLDCISSDILQNMSPVDFNVLLSKPVSEQSKVFRNIASYKCPNSCILKPSQECDFPAY